VTAIRPLPSGQVQAADEITLDAVIEQIDQSLSVIHQWISGYPANGAQPDHPPRASLSRIREAFQGMHNSPILTEDGSDIRLSESDEGLISKINGTGS
jgi:hypothetical protein